MKIYQNLFFGFLLIALPAIAFCQDSTATRKGGVKELKIVPLPAVASNPANGWMFGFAPSATWYLGEPQTTKISNFVGNFLYTTKRQWIFSFRSNIFLNENKWILVGDWRYFVTSQPTFGLGSTAPNLPSENPNQPGVWWGEQQMDFNLFRFYETVLKRIGDSKFYAGLGYHLDRHSKINNFTNENSGSNLEFSHDAYNLAKGFSTESYVLSGLTMNLIMENRDNPTSPYERNFALVSYKVNPTWLGSDQNSSTLLFDYRHYFNLSERRKRHLIAVWAYGNFLVSGNLPYMNLPSLGWDMFGRTGRAYAQGRFRGESMVYTEAEYRFPLQQNKETIGGTIFLNAASFGSQTTNERVFSQFNPGYGLGLRVMINKRNRTTISADYGIGQKGNSGFYLNINESF